MSNKTWPACKSVLNVKATVYVPGTQDVSKKISQKEHNHRALEVERKFREDFGGSTSIRATGTWESKVCEVKKVCRDDIILVESFMAERDWRRHSGEIKRYLEKKKKDWGQESLSFEFEILGKKSCRQGLHFV